MDLQNAEIGQLRDRQDSINDECEAVQVGDGHRPHYAARRLTPTECARLQGFPDTWCADIPHSDSAEYKLWGNGISLPVLLPMFKAIRKVYEENR